MQQLESTTPTRVLSYLNFVVMSTGIPQGFSEYSMSSRMSTHYVLRGRGARHFLFASTGWHDGCLCCARGAVGRARHTYVWSPSCGLWRPHMSGEAGGARGEVLQRTHSIHTSVLSITAAMPTVACLNHGMQAAIARLRAPLLPNQITEAS